MTTTGFDLDGRVRSRAQEEIKIGGRVFHPRKQDWETLREIDRAERAQDRTRRRVAKTAEELQKKADELEEAERFDEADEIHDQILAGTRETMIATANVLAAQIMDGQGEQPTAEFVFEHLDFSLIEDLVRYLNPRTEPVEETAGPR